MKNKFIKILIVLGVFFLLEIMFFIIYKHYKNLDEYNKFNYYSDVLIEEDGYVAVGHNNYYKDKRANYVDGALTLQGQIVKFDKNLNIVKEANYKDGYNLFLLSIAKTDDGYIAVGLDSDDSPVRGVILKYDKDLNFVKKQEYSYFEKTVLYKIVRDNDKYIILGRNVILKIDSDLNILEQNYYNENESVFHNIFVFDDYYLVTGSAANSTFIFNFSKNFNREEDDKEAISKKVISVKEFKNISPTFDYYYDAKLYGGEDVYNVKTGELSKINSDVVGNSILLISDNKIYSSYTDDNDKLYLAVYDLDSMKQIQTYYMSLSYIKGIYDLGDKLLINGYPEDEGSAYCVLKIIDK